MYLFDKNLPRLVKSKRGTLAMEKALVGGGGICPPCPPPRSGGLVFPIPSAPKPTLKPKPKSAPKTEAKAKSEPKPILNLDEADELLKMETAKNRPL